MALRCDVALGGEGQSGRFTAGTAGGTCGGGKGTAWSEGQIEAEAAERQNLGCCLKFFSLVIDSISSTGGNVMAEC